MVFKLASDRERYVKETDILYASAIFALAETVDVLVMKFTWREVGSRQMENCLYTLLYCHKFYTQFVLQYMRISGWV